jgi:predicted nuclease of predicted toxin-antitoxin system
VRLKLDENLGVRTAEFFRSAGHDVTTVPSQNLYSSPDKNLLETCRVEKRCLVTLDLEFGNPLLFKPSDHEGIAVLRLPSKPTPDDLQRAIRTLIGGLARKEIRGKLWIIQRTRIREYQPENEEI